MAIKVGVISIGDMGLGVAKLLLARKFAVTTCLAGRSEATRRRVKTTEIEIHEDMGSFVAASDVILSIVPPKDAFSTASAISDAFQTQSETDKHLHYFDLNAVAPSSAVKIGKVFASAKTKADNVTYYDGGIIGAPPKRLADSDAESGDWARPSIVISGPHSPFLPPAPSWAAELASALNITYLSDRIGQASGLKMCFASLTKGFTSLAIQSYTTAHRIGVLPELQKHLQEFSPGSYRSAERGLVGMPTKAYRWINEMEEISKTFDEEAGFEGKMFESVAEIYRIVAEDTILGEEKIEDRKRGLDPEDVADCINQGLQSKRQKKNGHA